MLGDLAPQGVCSQDSDCGTTTSVTGRRVKQTCGYSGRCSPCKKGDLGCGLNASHDRLEQWEMCVPRKLGFPDLRHGPGGWSREEEDRWLRLYKPAINATIGGLEACVRECPDDHACVGHCVSAFVTAGKQRFPDKADLFDATQACWNESAPSAAGKWGWVVPVAVLAAGVWWLSSRK